MDPGTEFAGPAVGRSGPGGYAVSLVVAGRRCVVVGAGRIAARKVEGLLAAGADVHVVSPTVGDRVRALADAGRCSVTERPFAPSDLDGAWLATVAAGDPAVDRAVAEAAAERRVWVNTADDAASCTFTRTPEVRRGDLVVTVGTGGRSPALAAWLRDRVADALGPEWADLVDLCGEAREALKAAGRPTEEADWQRAFDSGILGLIRTGQRAEAKELLQACLSSSSA